MVALVAAVVVAVSPAQIHFGDLVTATAQGTGQPSFAPFSVRARHGDTYVLQCLEAACVPGARAHTIRLGHARLRILPRATEAQVQEPLRAFRRETTQLPTSYRIDPNVLLALLLAGATALCAAALRLTAPQLRRLAPGRRDDRTALERALDLVRASAWRGVEDRRRALDLLGRVLANNPRARDAYTLAWSEPEPEEPGIEALVDAVERGA